MISPIWLRDIYSNIVVDITYLSWIDITYFKRWFQFIRISDRSITHSIQVVSKIKIEMWHRLFEWYRIQKNYFTNIFECTKDAVFHEYEHHQIYFSHNRKNNWWFFIIFFSLINLIDLLYYNPMKDSGIVSLKPENIFFESLHLWERYLRQAWSSNIL